MKNRIRRQMGDGGVSESIGFLLIFAMVITGIGLVTLYGYPMLLQQQTGADEQIMEKNIIVLQNDFKSIVYKTVPYKETSLKIGGGTLFVNNHLTSGPTFQIRDSTGAALMPDNPTGDLRYDSTSTEDEISLQNGAVVKRNLAAGSGSSMLAEPRWFFDEQTKTLVINVMNIGSSGPLSREGIGRVQMKLGQTEYLRKDYSPSTETISIIYTPGPGAGHDYTRAWQNYFENTMKMTCTTGPLTCTKSGVQVLVVKKTEVIITTL